MRELGILSAGEGLDDSFAEIKALAASCRFADCSHNNEPGCAIRKAIENGELNPGALPELSEAQGGIRFQRECRIWINEQGQGVREDGEDGFEGEGEAVVR